MKLPAFALAATLLSFLTSANAQSDCHQPLKDMLQGTLDHEGEANNSQTDTSQGEAGGCTLAEQLDVPSVFALS